jgi:diguanylate cyclase (GGDEF)-like protein
MNERVGRESRRIDRERSIERIASDERRVLVVENSHAVAQVLSLYITERCGLLTRVVHTLAQARATLGAEDAERWVAAVVNLELPDAAGEEIVRLTLSHDVPTIVLTGTFNEAMRRRILKHDVVDYCLQGKAGTEALVRTIERLQRAPRIKVLVVDDEVASRARQVEMLKSHRFQVLEATDGEHALAVYREQRDILLVITDQVLPKIDGLELVTRLREIARPEGLAVLGLSSRESVGTSVRFLKAGASDFLAKPFEREEYLCRVWANLEVIESVRKDKQAVFVDALTGTPNRLAFFRETPALLRAARRERATPAVALVSIDQLRQLNEVHGHAAGDVVLQLASRAMVERLGKSGLLARFNGEQFCAFVRDVPPAELSKQLERVCSPLDRTGFTVEGRALSATMSCGVAVCESDESLDSLVNRAGVALEAARTAGGNRIIGAADLLRLSR